MVTCLKIGDIRIHRIIEQEAPFFELKAFFPALTDDVLEENLSWLQPKHVDPTTGKPALHPKLSCADATSHDSR